MQHEKEYRDFYESISYESVFHDLKTPLSIMYACINEIEYNTYLKDNMRQPMTVLKRNWFRVMKLISDVSDAYKIVDGRMMPTYRNYDIVSLVRELAESTRLLTARRNITVKFDTNVEEKIMALDRDILDRILLNILSNSIKFTKADGTITVYIEESLDKLHITIADDGIGISESDALRIQEKYYKDNSIYNKNGTGLGLYIVKKLIDLMDGHIQINPKDIGTEVTVILPCFILSDNPTEVKYYDDFYSYNMIQIELSDDYE